MRRHLVHPSPAVVVAILALAVAVVGTALADPGQEKKPVTKRAVKKIAAKQVERLAPGLHVATADSAASATSAQTAGNSDTAVNAEHAADASTLQGAGLNSLQGRVQWALVRANGSILTQSGGIQVTGHPDPGVYYLDFGVPTSGKATLITNWYPESNLDVTAQTTACGSAADADSCNANGDPGGNPNDGNHVFVEISRGNTDENHGFYIALMP